MAVPHRPGMLLVLLSWAVSLMPCPAVAASFEDWPDPQPRRHDEGRGPFKRLLLVNARIVDGTGLPAAGPTTLVVEGDRIAGIGQVRARAGDEVIDVGGGYVLPGFVDTHVRVLDELTPEIPPDYTLKLLLAHGITTIAAMQPYRFVDWAVRLREASDAGRIVSPRIQVWADLEAGPDVESTLALIREAHDRGVAGQGEGQIRGTPEVVVAGLKEAGRLGMNTSWHMSQHGCGELDALEAARAGLRGLSHWYCLPEVLLDGRHPEGYPPDYAFPDVRTRFAVAGRLWRQVPPQGSVRWNATIEAFKALDFTFEPTFSVYEANRDYAGVSRAEWHERYLYPRLEQTFVSSPDGLFAHFYDWSSTYEADWRENFRIWMAFVRDYANRGGRVVAGADAGYMWTLPGFGFVRNLEMLQEAGLTASQVIRSATLSGAEHLRMADRIGSIAPGKLADLVVVDENPLDNLKVFYGTGYPGLMADGTVARKGGVRYTVKGGRVYDARVLLDDVAELVAQARARSVPAAAP